MPPSRSTRSPRRWRRFRIWRQGGRTGLGGWALRSCSRRHRPLRARAWLPVSGRGRELAGARWRRRGWICAQAVTGGTRLVGPSGMLRVVATRLSGRPLAAGAAASASAGCTDLPRSRAVDSTEMVSLSSRRGMLWRHARWRLPSPLFVTSAMLFPLHRKATVSPAAASKVLVRLEFRPLRSCRV